ncbi:MAG: hypothetical protein WD228_08285 [Mycobacterium sp.]
MTDGNSIDDAVDDVVDDAVDDAVDDDVVVDAVDDDVVVDDVRPVDGRLRIVAFGVLPAVVVALGAGAGVLGWQESSEREVQAARVESVAVARDSTVAMLSYRAETVEQDLRSARDRLTGTFLNSFTDLIDTVVIPGAKEKQISSTARVSAVASVSATAKRAVALVFVDQVVTVGANASDSGNPTGTVSSVRVTLDKVGDRWLVSGFDPV